MKKIAILSIFASLACGHTYSLKTGWNLLGATQSIAVQSILNKPEIDLVWGYNNGTWSFYTPNQLLLQKVPASIPIISQIDVSQGFWVRTNKDFDLTLDNGIVQEAKYFMKLIHSKDAKLHPLGNAKVYDNNNVFVGSTDMFGVLALDKKGSYIAKLEGFEDVSFYVVDEGIYVVNIASLKEEPPENSVISIKFDIENWFEGPKNTTIEAKVIPKVFSNLSKTYSLIVDEFSANQDLTLAVIENLTNPINIVSSMKVDLQKSNGETISAEDAKFVGRFTPVYNNKNLDISKQYALYFRPDSNQSWKFIELAKYDSKKGKLRPTTSVDKVGEYAFFAFDKLQNLTGKVTDINNAEIKDFYIMEENGEIHSYQNGTFNLAHSDAKKVTIFADGYKAKIVDVTTNATQNIVLEKLSTMKISFVANNYFGSSLPESISLFIEHDMQNISKNFTMKLTNGSYSIDNFPIELVGKEGLLEDGTVFELQNNSAITVAPKLNKLETSKDSIDYSNMIEFSGKIVNISSNGKIEWYDKTTLAKLGEKSLKLENVFDSFIVVEDKLLIGTMAGNIYSVSSDFNISSPTYSVDESFVVDNAEKFVFKPVLNDNKILWTTHNGYRVLTDANGGLFKEEKGEFILPMQQNIFEYGGKKYSFSQDTITVFDLNNVILAKVKINHQVTSASQINNKFFIKDKNGEILYFVP